MTSSPGRGSGPPESPGSAAKRIAILGGGSGISAVLRGLARRVDRGEPLELTAIVATADDGGSSGRIREERGGVPPGDLRNCLLALASGTGGRFARLFGHRYDGSGGLAGHSVGNLILAAIAEQERSWPRAAEIAGELLEARGLVIPVTPQGIRLEAEARDGIRISGESRIGRSHCAVHRVWLEPADTTPSPRVLDFVRRADLLVLGPGSLFTSLLAVLLVPGLADAVRGCGGRRVLVANLMTQPGETLGMNLVDHLEALDRHVGAPIVDVVLAHASPVDPERVRPYEAQGSEPLDAEQAAARSELLIRSDLVTAAGKIRHDPDRLAAALIDLVEPDRPSLSALRSRAEPPGSFGG